MAWSGRTVAAEWEISVAVERKRTQSVRRYAPASSTAARYAGDAGDRSYPSI